MMRRLTAVRFCLFFLSTALVGCSQPQASLHQPTTSSAAHVLVTPSAAVNPTAQNAKTPLAPDLLATQPEPAGTSPVDKPTPSATQSSIQAAGNAQEGLYFLAKDQAGKDQIFRFEPGSQNLSQLTHESAGVSDFDVSITGQLAYVTNNQLVLSKTDGSARTVLVAGSPDDGTDKFKYTQMIQGLSWSPDGKTLAYGQNGLNLFQIGSSSKTQALINELDQQGDMEFPKTIYTPDRWSPDGSRLLVNLSFYEGSTQAIYLPGKQNLVKLTRSDGQFASCCMTSWAADGSLYSAGFTYGGGGSDLWRYNPETGQGTNLIPAQSTDGTYNYVYWPQLTPDGKLIYFFANLPDLPSSSIAAKMVHSDADGVSGREPLHPETYYLNEALWRADSSLAAVVEPAPGDPVWPARGPVVLLYTDSRPAQPVNAAGYLLRWGP